MLNTMLDRRQDGGAVDRGLLRHFFSSSAWRRHEEFSSSDAVSGRLGGAMLKPVTRPQLDIARPPTADLVRLSRARVPMERRFV